MHVLIPLAMLFHPLTITHAVTMVNHAVFSWCTYIKKPMHTSGQNVHIALTNVDQYCDMRYLHVQR